MFKFLVFVTNWCTSLWLVVINLCAMDQ